MSDPRTDPRFGLAMRQSGVGMALVAPDGSFLEVNDALCAILDRTRAELAAATWQELTHPDDVAKDVALVQGMLESQREGYRLAKRYLRPDGTIVHGDLSVACVRGESGALEYFISQIVDVSENWALAERYRLLAENVNDVVVLGDNDGVIVWVLPSVTAIMGWLPEEMAGIAFITLVHPDDVPSVAAVQAGVSRGEPGQFEARLRCKSGDYRWLNVRVRPILDEHGTVVGRVAGWWDAEAAHQANEALQASEAQARDLAARYEAARNEALAANLAKTVFLSRMSHELRTPLNAVLGFAQLLAMDDLTDDQSDAVRQIRTGGKHLLRLLTEIMDISRIDSGRISLSMESVSVADAMDEALDLVRTLAEQADVTVGWASENDRSGQVWADRQRVIQILLNLLTNAVKYNRPGGSVVVSSQVRADATLAVHVRDTGHGLSPDQLARVFEPFDRLGAEQTAVEGTGIGLTLSQGLARVMSGRLEVASTPGEGTVFSLILPTSTASPIDDIPLPPVAHAPTSRRIRALCIEDNPTNTHLMSRIADLHGGTELRTAAEGSAGLAAAAEERPDLVFLDLHLPDMPGEAVLERLLQLPTMDGVPVVVVTADATPGLGARLKSLGAEAVLTKPVDVAEVLSWLDHPTARRY